MIAARVNSIESFWWEFVAEEFGKTTTYQQNENKDILVVYIYLADEIKEMKTNYKVLTLVIGLGRPLICSVQYPCYVHYVLDLSSPHVA